MLAPLWADPALEGKRVYIRTLIDRTFPVAVQTIFIENCGVDWKIVDVEGGHCAFISRPADVAEVIVGAAESWA